MLVFPTVDGKVVAGPTAHDQEDKDDWSVRPEARDEVLPKAVAMLPALEGAEPIAAYAGLRPAGRGVQLRDRALARVRRGSINVAAIRSTGLTASLGIAEHVVGAARRGGRRRSAPSAPLRAGRRRRGRRARGGARAAAGAPRLTTERCCSASTRAPPP